MNLRHRIHRVERQAAGRPRGPCGLCGPFHGRVIAVVPPRGVVAANPTADEQPGDRCGCGRRLVLRVVPDRRG
jgi:hypothetical protein